MLINLLKIFKKKEEEFDNPTTFDDDEDEVLSMLDNYDKTNHLYKSGTLKAFRKKRIRATIIYL